MSPTHARNDYAALLFLLAGFSLWAAGFVLLYALQVLGCAYGWPAHRAILVSAFGAVLVPLALLARLRPKSSGPLAPVALWLNRAALAAGVLTFLPVVFASTCL